MNEHIPIFLASDNSFAPFVAVTIVSVMENTKSYIDFYILDSGISDLSKVKITSSTNKYLNCRIEFIGIDKTTFEHMPECEIRVTQAAYNRLLIPELKPELKKVIYSDVDVVFLGDVKELYEESLSGHIIGVVHDAGYMIYGDILDYQFRLNLPNNHEYFYSGLLLIDAVRWRKERLTDKLIQLGQTKGSRLKLGDQDILNMFFGSSYKLLSVKYEATTTYILNSDKFNSTIRNDLENIVIRHFEGAEKPWCTSSIKGKQLPNTKDFWKYALKTDFYFYSLKHLMVTEILRCLEAFLELFYCPIEP